MSTDDTDLTPADALREMLEVLIDAFGLEADVTIEESDGVLRGSVDGEDVEALIGDRGSVVDAVQHLAQRLVLRGGEGLRVVVDVGGYRVRREAELIAQANMAADAAIVDGAAVPLQAMPASERRFVHEYLRERGDVTTHSEGDEPRRYLVVTPAGA
jgi:spoIIIJ-associated protein